MTQGINNNGKLPPFKKHVDVKKGTCIPDIALPEEVADDLRRYIFNLIDTKKWAGQSDRKIAGDIINADEDGTDSPRFYTLFGDERERLSLTTVRKLLKTYRHKTLEVFKEDLMPYLQEAIVEVIKTAGQKPANLKIIVDALGIGKEAKDVQPKPDTPTPAYLKIPKGLGDGRRRLEANAPKRTSTVIAGLRAFGYEGLVRDNISKRRRLAARVVPRRDDPGMDGPPNIIEVDGGPYAFTAIPSEDDVLDYGREHLDNIEKPEHRNPDELSGVEADEKGDGNY